MRRPMLPLADLASELEFGVSGARKPASGFGGLAALLCLVVGVSGVDCAIGLLERSDDGV
jgi:hypothetical protein